MFDCEPRCVHGLACSRMVSYGDPHKASQCPPRNLQLHVQHRMKTRGPMPVNTRASIMTARGTRFRFAAAVKSSFASVLPHFGHRPENILTFLRRFGFMCGAGRGLTVCLARSPPQNGQPVGIR